MKIYSIQREEVARQVHHVIREIYRNYEFDGDSIIRNIVSDNEDDRSFVFNARQFAEEYDIEPEGFIDNLCRELGIEYEKNLHDRFLFSMSHDESAIYFKQINGLDK